MPNQNRLLVPQAASLMDQFKLEIANEIGLPTYGAPRITQENCQQILDQMKYEIAGELGLLPQIQNGYWGDVPARLCGAVGGRIGGKIGGNLVRNMIRFAEQNLSR